MEANTNIARFFCGICYHPFRAYLDKVTLAKKTPVCLRCIKEANIKRHEKNVPPIPYFESAYLPDVNS